MSFDDAYESLTDHDDDARWAYGTGFADPMAGVSTEVPTGVDRADLTAYCLMLGDDALIMSHRLQQWVTRAPELEDELAIANIGLDLLGQARLLLSRAGEVEAAGRGEDALAYLRDADEFRNVRMAEWNDDDFAQLVARLLIFSTWRLALFDRLATARDPVLSAIAAKGVKEVTYHREYAAQWVVRLGDGTAVSHARMQTALDMLWPLTAELFRPHEIESRLAAAGIAVDPSTVDEEVSTVLDQVLPAATLHRPSAAEPDAARAGGRDGTHGPELAEILDELQGLARSLPGEHMVSAAEVVGTVADPELPMLTLDDLGIVRDVREDADRVLVTITPTYSGCPAMETIRDDIVEALRSAGFARADVRTVLAPPWSSDWISDAGRAKLAAAGISPPGPAPRRAPGPVPLVLGGRPALVTCPQCGHRETERVAAFSATACRELRRCPACREPFEHVKEI